ncbi:Pal1 cell morphology protein [Geosmithia morbida]|uniref:Pal1 cell morphology protein n=1 Tax=Geosmithia morbida TaxID=1094350 RepID=A0A9P4YZT8_9HYPO|nr:Pal1 cell morphology protein [Geosmithia morbida]KAF4124809.1 Pal1 cell morphology protein [Geosmithia morbida]
MQQTLNRTPSAASSRPPSYRSVPAPGHHSGSSSSASPSARTPLTPGTPSSSASRSMASPLSNHHHRSSRMSPSSRPHEAGGDRRHRHSHSVPRSSRHRRGISLPDAIDALDTIGGAYHHDGPYEATLASRNINKKYAPVDAVRESNMAALRATPEAYIRDSLERHVPLQGTSTVPSGFYDIGGKLMDYEEGADLMREASAGGGAYKRWDFMDYHPDDLKGKGEPSYTYDRLTAQKKGKGLLSPESAESYEMQGRMRSVSSGAYDARSSGLSGHGKQTHGGLGSGLKRRFGSLRKKDDNK